MCNCCELPKIDKSEVIRVVTQKDSSFYRVRAYNLFRRYGYCDDCALTFAVALESELIPICVCCKTSSINYKSGVELGGISTTKEFIQHSGEYFCPRCYSFIFDLEE